MAIPLIIKRIAIFLGYDVGVQEGNIRKTMAARGLVNGRSPLRRSGRDLVFRCYPPELLSPHKKTEADLLGQPPHFVRAKGLEPIRTKAPDPKSGLATNYNTPAIQWTDSPSEPQS